MAAAAVSLACPLRRSTRLAHAHAQQELADELTPRALRALKRQRLSLDPDGLPPRTKKRKKSPPSKDPPKQVQDSSSSDDPDPLTPLTPLTPSPESSPSLPGHDRQPLPPVPDQQQSATDSFSPPPPPLPPSLDPTLDTLIPFDTFHPHFDPELSVQIPSPPTPPQLQGLQLHTFPQHQLYVPPNPVFARDREINIWKLACQERVDCLLRRYGVDYIKALVESQARSVARETCSSPSPGPSQTTFRLYTPASYTYSLSSSWSATPGSSKSFPVDDHPDDPDPTWPMDDADWVDGDIDMEDEDEDDYEDEDDSGEGETPREGEVTVEGLVITDTATPNTDPRPMDVDGVDSDSRPMTKPIPNSELPAPSRPSIPHPFPSPPLLTPPTLPSLSSLHVPLLSEPPRSFMGRGTPPDRRRLVEWSGSGRFAANGMGPPLYLSPVPQRHSTTDVDIVPMSVDPSPPPHPTHTHGEWTSFLYSMLEGDGVGVGVGVGTSIGGAGHASEPAWYELGLASVQPVVPEPALGLPPTHTARTMTPTVSLEHPVDEGSNSSSTLRFALG